MDAAAACATKSSGRARPSGSSVTGEFAGRVLRGYLYRCPRLATNFTNRPEEVQNALLTAQSRGRTSLLDAIYMGIHKMKDARYSRRALLIISDGGDNHSRYSDHDVKSAVKEADILIYSVGTFDRYVSTQEELMGPQLLQSVSDVTGGQAYTLTNEAELPTVARSIGARLRHQYMLAYRPQTEGHDGKWHKISVKLRLPKKWPSFFALPPEPDTTQENSSGPVAVDHINVMGAQVRE